MHWCVVVSFWVCCNAWCDTHMTVSYAHPQFCSCIVLCPLYSSPHTVPIYKHCIYLWYLAELGCAKLRRAVCPNWKKVSNTYLEPSFTYFWVNCVELTMLRGTNWTCVLLVIMLQLCLTPCSGGKNQLASVRQQPLHQCTVYTAYMVTIVGGWASGSYCVYFLSQLPSMSPWSSKEETVWTSSLSSVDTVMFPLTHTGYTIGQWRVVNS